MTTSKKFIAAVFFLSFLFSANTVFAATVLFEMPQQQYASGAEFLVPIYLSINKDSLNAVEGLVTFPSDLLEVKEIRDGNSAVSFWVNKPIVPSGAAIGTAKQGVVSFSGITPGGFSLKKSFLFAIVFRAKKSGSGQVMISNLKVYLNDGSGTQIPLKNSTLALSVIEATTATPSRVLQTVDIDQPELFTATIAKDPNICDGEYFLVFDTTDKGTGIDHYEIREGNSTGVYGVAVSPYLLKDQSLGQDIFVKAVDKAGNERIVIVSEQSPWYQRYSVIGIIILIIIIFGITLNQKWRRIFS